MAKIIICTDPFPECLQHPERDSPCPETPKSLDEGSAIQSNIEGRRVLCRVERLGVADLVNEMFGNRQKTLEEIAAAVFQKTGQKISLTALSGWRKRNRI